MTFSPLLTAPIVIQLHAFSAIVALLLGPFILFARKGDARHRFLGRIWFGFMAIAVGSSWLISNMPMLGPFSFIHIFSLMGTIVLFQIIWHARNGRIQAHQSSARGLYFGGLIVAGTLAFLPDRIMNEVFFGGDSQAGFYLIASLVLVGFAFRHLRNRLVF